MHFLRSLKSSTGARHTQICSVAQSYSPLPVCCSQKEHTGIFSI